MHTAFHIVSHYPNFDFSIATFINCIKFSGILSKMHASLLYDLVLTLLFLLHVQVSSAHCNADNCLKALRGQSHTASNFCKSYTGATASLPKYLSACSYLPSRISSACSCLITTSSATPSTSPTISTTRCSACPPSSTRTVSVPATSLLTCPSPATITSSYTATFLKTVTAPASTVTSDEVGRISVLTTTTITTTAQPSYSSLPCSAWFLQEIPPCVGPIISGAFGIFQPGCSGIEFGATFESNCICNDLPGLSSYFSQFSTAITSVCPQTQDISIGLALQTNYCNCATITAA